MADDLNISPSGTTDITDTTSPDSNPSTNGDSQTPADDSTPQTGFHGEDQPSTAPAPTSGQPNQPQPGDQQQNSNQPQQQKPNTPQGAPQQPSAAQTHPLVQKANILRQTAQALAGGPRYTESIDVNTGKMSRTQVPMSKSDIGLAIAMEAITGSLSGLSLTGPGATGRAAAAGGQAVMQQQQQVQQQQDQQANADYARHAQVFEGNLRMMQLAQSLGQKDFETNQQFAGQYKPLADQVQSEHPEAILGVGGEQDASKYHATKNSAIPTGNVIPVFDPNTGKQAVGAAGNKLWQQEYMYIDPNFKGDNFLSKDDIATGQKYGILPTGNLPDSIPMRMSMALNYKNRISAMGMADKNVQEYYKQMGEKAPDLIDAVKKDRTLTDAFEKFQPLLAATGNDYGKAIGELAAGGQGRQPNPQAAGKILNLYGGSDMVHKFDEDQANEKEQQKKTTDKRAAYDGALNTQTAESIMSDTNATSEQKQRAQAFLKTDQNREVNMAATKAGVEARARTQGEIDTKKANGIPLSSGNTKVGDMIKDPNVQGIGLDPNEKNLTNGVNTTYLDQLRGANPSLAALIEQIGSGQQMQSAYALAKNDGQVLGSMVARAFPNYQFQKADAFGHAYKSFTSGKDKDQIEAGNTTYRHLSALFDAAGNTLLIPGSDAKADFDVTADKALEEIHGAYTPGVQHQEQYDRASQGVKSPFPWVRQEAVKKMAELLSDKSGEKQNSYRRVKPTDKIPDFNIISPDAQAAFKHITGKNIGDNGYADGSLSASPHANPASFTPPAGAFPGRDGQGNIVQYKLPNGSIVDAKTGQPVSH